MSLVELPPLLPELKELVESYLLHPEDLPIHSLQETRKYVHRTPDYYRLFEPKTSSLSSTLQVTRDLATGEITGLEEVFNLDTGLTNKNSLSLQRAPGPPDESVRGSSTNLPFWPGGFDPKAIEDDLDNDILLDFTNLLTQHPKLSGGIDFKAKVKDTEEDKDVGVIEEAPETSVEQVKEELSITDMLLMEDNDMMDIFGIQSKQSVRSSAKAGLVLGEVKDEEEVINSISVGPSAPKPKNDDDVIQISKGAEHGKFIGGGTEWVEVINVNAPVDDFKVKVPDPACSYPFELDIFQKQAIIHLEQQDCVFVAAHTSAGKTVVAEYSIALALKHMTRAIYTSPIKALSNQKYRDLKIKFGDVGLLTGDIQINPKAACLIMTTEILQSMLYNGSDVIRDLEWVIFDEVHYINNAERGHVWEEVIIMLPSHVNIVLLSATVPNTTEFADWIGRIKKRKIYVISTTKRPVPLEHFLYTGSGGKTKDERFLILDSNGTFVRIGYADAMAAKKGREKKSAQSYGPKQRPQHMGDKQEKNMWIGLIDHLGKNNLLPVVAFTLSKKRCDSNASNLLSQDLTTKAEKGEIESFIRKCLDRLHGTDKCLPQVVRLRELLRNGIGVHHSGILPMLKEVVEMLFAKGLVKVLFATETFAMGVNMPARCVVFDSIRKHDGKRMRDLVPSEYIQMAGRAGRRGLDTTGTVIILCKNDVPEMADLHQMMLGNPSKLESQFKLTYSMILNLLRVEALRVEDMMKRSFSEALQLINQSKYSDTLDRLTKDVSGQEELSCVMCKDIKEYYGISRDLVQQRKKIYGMIAGYPSVIKCLQPGRVIIISHKFHQNFVACLLKIDPRDKDKLIVLILSDPSVVPDVTENTFEMMQCIGAKETIHIVSETSEYELLNINPNSIVAITKKTLKIFPDKIIDNINKRKIPRFKDDPPGQSVQDLVSQMQRIHQSGGSELSRLAFGADLGINDLDSVMHIEELEIMQASLKTQTCVECPQFREHFAQAYTYLKTREEIGRLKYLMSEESLQLHPEYQMRIAVLKELGYIEDNKTVTLKGRIACEMGSHELMVTELLLENIFANMPIEIIVALLSSLVFQQKFCSQPEIKENLEEGIKEFKRVATKIGIKQRDCGLLEPVSDFVDQFNFGLVEVVYEWAHGMPFCKIMELTDVQEGVTVKCIQRLDEALKDVRNAARIVGDTNLFEKMEKASAAIKRDIVFAASLYTQ
uniref:Helicase SKI2W-like n=1 Tax=Hirondellea gigas TaxID=1518452 RepID=A0A6A7FXB5_9CRUS